MVSSGLGPSIFPAGRRAFWGGAEGGWRGWLHGPLTRYVHALQANGVATNGIAANGPSQPESVPADVAAAAVAAQGNEDMNS